MACPSYELCTTFACKTFCMVYDHVSSSRVWLEIMNGKQLYMLLHYISLNNEHFKGFVEVIPIGSMLFEESVLTSLI